VDAVEQGRGFDPPVFVDTRISRSVRAVGFQKDTFARMLGSGRYLWMPRLGNKAVLSRSGPAIQINDPEAAKDLLDFATEAGRAGRRVLFFCACEWPALGGETNCHRTVVGNLVLDVARQRGENVEVVEWPGGEPEGLKIEVGTAEFRSVTAGAKSVRLANPGDLGRYGAVPWGSLLTIRSESGMVQTLTGPARHSSSVWCLPLLGPIRRGDASAELRVEGRAFRRLHGLESRSVRETHRSSGRPELRLSDSCVYTIAHRTKLEAALSGNRAVTLRESRPWTTAAKLLRSAQEAGCAMPILFADAADCSTLLFWALLQRITVGERGTEYVFEHLRRLRGGHRPQELHLLKTGRRIAPDFIRPYALCRTPAFLSSKRN
jgi:hypothetical protein